MNTAYAILATVTLQHDYYADSRTNDFEIVPSTATASVLKGLGILTKTIGNSLILLVRVDEKGDIFTDLPADLSMAFYLKLNNPHFVNFTNAPYQQNHVFYFTNLHKTRVGATHYLNSRLPEYHSDTSTAYSIGDIVHEGDAVFEAVKKIPASAPATSDATAWFPRASAQYVHYGDLMRLTDGVLPVKIAPSKTVDITLFGHSTASLNYDLPAAEREVLQFDENQETVVVSLTNKATGSYKVVVNEQPHFVYLDAAASYARVFGIVELYNIMGAEEEFNLVELVEYPLVAGPGVITRQHPRGLDYVIHFANRLARWKYLTRSEFKGVQDSITPPKVPYTFTPLPPVPANLPLNAPARLRKEFLSDLPLPLKQLPVTTLQLVKQDNALSRKLANPPPDRISTLKDGESTYYCAEMRLNY